nr:hypothetical protein [Tanacetum cinerariifolium]
ELSAAVQNALQTLLPQIRAEIREEFRSTAGTTEEQTNNFQWGLRRSTLNHLMCMPFTDVAQDDDDAERPDKRHPGECRQAAGTCFKCGQIGHLHKDCKKNTAASTSGQADKKPGASGRVFAI